MSPLFDLWNAHRQKDIVNARRFHRYMGTRRGRRPNQAQKSPLSVRSHFVGKLIMAKINRRALLISLRVCAFHKSDVERPVPHIMRFHAQKPKDGNNKATELTAKAAFHNSILSVMLAYHNSDLWYAASERV